MVHNGIEYGDMQLICEAYDILKNVLGMSAAEMHDVFAEWNKGELDSYLDRDHPGHPRLQGRGRPAARGQDPRHRRPEGHRQVDGHRGARARHPAHPHRRGGLRPLPLGHQGRACRRLEGARRPEAEVRGRPQGLRRGRPQGPVRLQDRLLRPGLHAHARGGQGARLEPQLRRRRPHVARRLHHPLGLPRARSRRPSTRTPASPTCCSTPSSGTRSWAARTRGAAWSPRR